MKAAQAADDASERFILIFLAKYRRNLILDPQEKLTTTKIRNVK